MHLGTFEFGERKRSVVKNDLDYRYLLSAEKLIHERVSRPCDEFMSSCIQGYEKQTPELV